MIEDRLLAIDDDITGEPRVDLAHEIMIPAWPRLADWIRSHRVDEQQHRRLEAAAALWVEYGRGGGGLLDALQLAEAELWQETDSAVELGHSAEVEAFIAESRAAQNQQRRRRRLIAGASWFLGLVAVAVAAAALAARAQANYAQEQATEAQRQRLRADKLVARSYAEAGRQLLLERRSQEAVAYLVAARRGGEDNAPLRMMFQEAKQYLPIIPALEHQVSAANMSAAIDTSARHKSAPGSSAARRFCVLGRMLTLLGSVDCWRRRTLDIEQDVLVGRRSLSPCRLARHGEKEVPTVRVTRSPTSPTTSPLSGMESMTNGDAVFR